MRSRLAQPDGTVDAMSSVSVCNEKNGAVVGEHMHLGSVGVSRNGGRTAKGWNIAICMLLASVLGLCLMLWITPPVHADDSAGLGITATDDITDTQNLLGSNVSEITDAINQTKKETGVTVRLVYLDSFNAKGKPDKWVSALLESLNPKPNTVMLAVASNDGNLVVAVSSNSEEWLKKKSTVDALSDAAQKPLMESDPDWAKSATDMMNQISVQKKDLDFVADHMDWRGRIRRRAAASGGASGGVPYPAQEGRDRASA